MIVYYIIVVVRYITSISYNTNTGNTLCNAPDVQHRIYGLYPSCLIIIHNSNCDKRIILHH